MPQYAKINVSLIDKNRLFKGKKGTYLDLVIIETPNSEYGTHMIKQSISREEKEKGVEMPILGNITRPKAPAANPSGEPPKSGLAEDATVPF